MKRNQWQRIEHILDRALTLETPDKQRQYILEASKDEPQLQGELTALLRAIHKANQINFLDR